MKWAKLHGLGNDFLVVSTDEAAHAGISLGALAAFLCRRRTGIGADGVIFFRPEAGGTGIDVSAEIYNADGSFAELSGNGTRCLAAFLIYSGALDGASIRVGTVSGIKVYTLEEKAGSSYVFSSTLGCPVSTTEAFPCCASSSGGKCVDIPLVLGAETVRVTLVSMGNPHCSTFWPDVNCAPVERLGPELEHHPWFPNRSNVEFIQVLDRHRIRVRFWERGVGVTLASGTGSAAAAVASILNGCAESPVRVDVELGTLTVRWHPPGELVLTGPAEYICGGDVAVPAEA